MRYKPTIFQWCGHHVVHTGHASGAPSRFLLLRTGNKEHPQDPREPWQSGVKFFISNSQVRTVNEFHKFHYTLAMRLIALAWTSRLVRMQSLLSVPYQLSFPQTSSADSVKSNHAGCIQQGSQVAFTCFWESPLIKKRRNNDKKILYPG